MSIDPPYRLDPLQNIVNVNWGAQDFLLGGADSSQNELGPGYLGPPILFGSKDGIEFIEYNTAGLDIGIASMAYAGGFWFAVTSSGKVFKTRSGSDSEGNSTGDFSNWTQIYAMPPAANFPSSFRKHYMAYGKAKSTNDQEYEVTLMIVTSDPSLVSIGEGETPATEDNYIARSTDLGETWTLTDFTGVLYVLTSCQFLKDDRGGAFYVTETPTSYSSDFSPATQQLPCRYWRSPDGDSWTKGNSLAISTENNNFISLTTQPWLNSVISGVAWDKEANRVIAVGVVPSEEPREDSEFFDYFSTATFMPGATLSATKQEDFTYFHDDNFSPAIALGSEADTEEETPEEFVIGTTANLNLFNAPAAERIVGSSTPEGAFVDLTSNLGGSVEENWAHYGAINYSKSANRWVSTGWHFGSATNQKATYVILTSKNGNSWTIAKTGLGELKCIALGKLPGEPPTEE